MNERFMRRTIFVAVRGTFRFVLIATVSIAALFWTVPAQAQISDSQVGALVEALRLSAPNTGIPNDGLYSDWKIKWENIIRWSKRCTGTEVEPAEFEANVPKAREILSCVMGKILREQYAISRDESIAVRRAASWWMTGDPDQYDSLQTRPYTQKVLDFYRKVPK
ncbi:MAG: hypothetical protein AB9866_22310 [Syntrophobacteraceae bacterium]